VKKDPLAVYKFKGSSMCPTLQPGDWLLVEPLKHYEVGEIVVFHRGRLIIAHRLIKMDGLKAHTTGDYLNSQEEISQSDIIGRVQYAIRGRNILAIPPKPKGLARILTLMMWPAIWVRVMFSTLWGRFQGIDHSAQ